MKPIFRIYIASDSTAQGYKESDRPKAGWGEMLQNYLTKDIEVVNKAIGGRSSRLFIEQGRLAEIEKVIQEGDYLLVQFGHNDASIDKPERYVSEQEFPAYIKEYIDVARKNKAIPILITPVGRRDYDEQTQKFRISFPQYRNKMIEVAKETNTALIDLGASSIELFNQVGIEESKKLFLHVEPNRYESIPDGIQDNTHFQVEGAIEIAKLIAKGIKELDIDLSHKIVIEN